MEKANTVSIYWDDLTETKQAEIIDVFGDNCNFDVFPVVEIPVGGEHTK